MNKAQAAALNALKAASSEAQRALHATRQDSVTALESFSEGVRFPHDPAAVARTASKAATALAKVETLLDVVNALNCDGDDVLAAYEGKASYFHGDEA